ncbi:MAG: hypothetical protein JNM80_12505 [Phycisphaerae bacterium]|nr:hypothetical protein [Phycisphaerae bacterium]
MNTRVLISVLSAGLPFVLSPLSANGQAGGLEAWSGESGGKPNPSGDTCGPETAPHGAFIHTSAGYQYGLAVRVTGQVVGWGGASACFPFQTLPVPTPVPPPWASADAIPVSAHGGYDHGIILFSDGTIFGWGGNNAFGQNGNLPPVFPCNCIPLDPGTEWRFRTISTGEYINIGIRLHLNPDGTPGIHDREIVTWGFSPSSPAALEYLGSPLPASTKVKQAVAGGHFVAVLDDHGNITTWGTFQHFVPIPPALPYFGPNYRNTNPTNNPNNCHPYGNPPCVYTPGYTPGIYGAIAAGHLYVIGFVKDANGNLTGEVHAWGAPANGVLNLPESLNFAEISPGYYQGMWIPKTTIPTGVATLGHWDKPIEQGGQYNTGVPFPFPPTTTKAYWGLAEASSAFHHTALVGCYANCDNSTTAPVLDANDLICFNIEFACATGDCASTPQTLEEQIRHCCNCDGSTTAPIFTANDLVCFNFAYAAGCKPGKSAKPY